MLGKPGGLPLPGKISTLPRNVSHTSGRSSQFGSLNLEVLSVTSRCLTNALFTTPPVCLTAAQFKAMNSCHANAAACCIVALGAPPFASFNSVGTGELMVIGIAPPGAGVPGRSVSATGFGDDIRLKP